MREIIVPDATSLAVDVDIRNLSSAQDSVDTELPAAAALSDAASNPTTPTVGAANLLFNGATWERERGNTEITMLSVAARTATVNSADFTNYRARGGHFILRTTVVASTPSIRLRIQGKDPVTSQYYDVLAGTPVTASGIAIYKIYPGIVPVTSGAASDVLPRTFRARVEHNDSDSITYSVGASLIT